MQCCVAVSAKAEFCIVNIWLLQVIDPLPAIDHSEIEYAEFTKNFYEEHEDISNMTPDHMIQLRKKLGINVHFITLLTFYYFRWKFYHSVLILQIVKKIF